MEGSIRFISSGDISVGMWITLGNLRPIKRDIVTPSGEKVEIEEKDMNPYLKGAPFRVLEVARPLLLLENWCQIPNVPPAVIWDTRLAEFIEISERYAEIYRRVVYPPAPVQVSPFIGFSDAQLTALKILADTLLTNAALSAQSGHPNPPPDGNTSVETDPNESAPIIGGDFGPPPEPPEPPELVPA